MKKRANNATQVENEVHMPYSIPMHDHSVFSNNKISMRSHNPHYRGIKKMANKVSDLPNLVQRFTSCCFLNTFQIDPVSYDSEDSSPGDANGDQFEDLISIFEGEKNGEPRAERVIEMEIIMGEVFDAITSMKSAYVSLQEAHSPWDPEKMGVADVAVVAELRRLAALRERFWRSVGGGGGGRWSVGAATLREVVAPYEAAVDEMRRKLKARDAEILNLKERIKTTPSCVSGGKKGKSKRKVNCSTQAQVKMPSSPSPTPAPELFESTMSLVKQASKSFTSSLLTLMRSAQWDIAAAVRSIEAAYATTVSAATPAADAIIGTNHAKYALESHINRKLFQGFDNETFNMDENRLNETLKQRSDCFAQFLDLKSLDPVELVEILPKCSFGSFCLRKYASMVHPRMEESLFGDLDQRRRVLAGKHPRTRFYGEFVGLCKAVWLLHLLAFSLDPAPCHFEANRESRFHPEYMESVVRGGCNGIGGKFGLGLVVGFPVSPGFKLGNGSVIKARVYLVPTNGL